MNAPDAVAPDDFVIARNPEPETSLPYLVRVPLGSNGLVLKVRETWPRTSRVYCHRAEWPDEVEVVERVPTKACTQRGAAIDLVLDRGREARSQFVLTRGRGREMIFWQSARVTKQARPVVTPTARAAGIAEVEILVDVHERYAWKFSGQQVRTVKRPLTAGDYAVEWDGRVVGSVERKSLPDLVSTLTQGRGSYLMAALAEVGHAAIVVEDRYSKVFSLDRVRPAVVAEAIAEGQVRFPTVPIIFCESRQLAQEWTYRFLAAARHEAELAAGTPGVLAGLTGGELPPAEPSTDRTGRPKPAADGGASVAEIRAWALASGMKVSDRGRLRPEVVAAYREAHPNQG